MSRGCTLAMIVFWASFVVVTLVANLFMETARAAEVGAGGALAALCIVFVVVPALEHGRAGAGPRGGHEGDQQTPGR